ncbi:hypothetical protein [Viridibacillus arvi]|uniref:hypothetical protein n=1 Tax=Viridibacillus arvi TaxID=263475 RepID=UPI0034CE4DB6
MDFKTIATITIIAISIIIVVGAAKSIKKRETNNSQKEEEYSEAPTPPDSDSDKAKQIAAILDKHKNKASQSSLFDKRESHSTKSTAGVNEEAGSANYWENVLSSNDSNSSTTWDKSSKSTSNFK